jgi:preprotein translocase subunit SecG
MLAAGGVRRWCAHRRFSLMRIGVYGARLGAAPGRFEKMLFKLLLAIHILVCLALVIVVLLQSSKGGGLAGAFGGGGGQTMFGGQETATFLSKTTTYLAVMFMVLSLALAFLSAKQGTARPRSVIREAAERQQNVIPRAGEQDIQQLLSGAADTTAAGAVVDTSSAPAQ